MSPSHGTTYAHNIGGHDTQCHPLPAQHTSMTLDDMTHNVSKVCSGCRPTPGIGARPSIMNT